MSLSNGERRPRAGGGGRILAAAALCAALLGGCAWRRVEPRFDPVAPARRPGVVGLAAADPDTSLRDLQAVARLWSEWNAFERVQFPYRDGDAVDLLVEVRLRQRVDAHRAEAIAKGIAVGLSFGLLSPFLGPRISAVHDVGVRCPAAGTRAVPRTFELRTEAVFGPLANANAVAEELDAVQTLRLAAALLEAVGAECGTRPAAPAPGR